MTTKTPEPVATLFARQVRPDQRERYESWLAGISRATSRFPGNRGTSILRPAKADDDYVAITHFDNQANLQRWLDSTERRQWLKALDEFDVDHQQVTSLAGMERWFSRAGSAGLAEPPNWKTALVVLGGLYPVCLALAYVLNPLMAGLPMPVQLFVSLVATVPIMVWFVLPWLSRRLAGWLHPSRRVPAQPQVMPPAEGQLGMNEEVR